MAMWGGARGGGVTTTSKIKKQKQKKKSNVRFNILDEGYPLNNVGIA